MRSRVRAVAIGAAGLFWTVALAAQTPAVSPGAAAPGQGAQPPAIEAVAFDEAVSRALERNPNVGQAVQNILRAEALLQSARTVNFPTVNATATTTVLNEARGFGGQVTQPQTQSAVGVSVAYPVLAAARWAQRLQAADQVRVARVAADETRRQVALAVSQAYLAVIAQRRQVDVNLHALENARAHLDYAGARLRAGAGSRLNELRAAQEVSTDEVLLEVSRFAVRLAQEALGVLLMADAPIDAAAEPVFALPPAPEPQTFLSRRIDVRLAAERVSAAERVARDSWKDWVPTGIVSFQPQYLSPAGLFQPSRTWNAVAQLAIPVFDGGLRGANARLREVAVVTARLEQIDVEQRARAERRTAEAAVESTARAVESARRAAAQAEEVVRITDVAFRAGATTNLEVIDAQRRARDAGTTAARAEDRARQARLDLLVALGLFPH